MRRRAQVTLAGVLATALAAVTLPTMSSATLGAWTDAEFVHAGSLRTEATSCATDTDYLSRSFARFVSGRLPGIGSDSDSIDLSARADVVGLELVRNQLTPVVVTPATSRDLAPNDQDPNSDTYANPLRLTAANTVGLDLTGLGVGLPVGSAGAVNQYGQVTNHGTAVAASGLVSDSGAVGVTSGTPSSALPGAAVLSLARVLPANPGVSRADLTIGAVASSARLDWCAARQSAVWGDGSVSGVTRQYGVAGVGVRVTSPLVAELSSAVNSTVTALNASVVDLTGAGSASIRATILTTVQNAANPPLVLGTVSGSVSIAGLDLTAAVAPFLSRTLTDGVVSVDLATGQVTADLAALTGVGSLSSQAPNTQLTLTSAAIDPISTRVSALLSTWQASVDTAITTAVRNARLTVNLVVNVGTSAAAPNAIELTIGANGRVGALLDGAATFAVTSRVLVADPANTLTPLANSLAATLPGQLDAAVAGQLSAALIAPVVGTASTSLASRLRTTAASIRTAVSTVLAPLPNVVSVAVNVQPDQPNPLPGDQTQSAIRPNTSAEYRITALRIGLVDSAAQANGFLYLALGSSTVGRNTRF